jgi:hypothetical protein
MIANAECGLGNAPKEQEATERTEDRFSVSAVDSCSSSLFRTPHSAPHVPHSSEPGGLATEFGTEHLPARVETEDGRRHFALLSAGPDGSLCLIAARILLGKKVRVILLRPDRSELLVGSTFVLRTLRLPNGLYENGTAIVLAGSVTQRP